MRDWLEELRSRIGDGYWRADHPEFGALMVALIGGAVGLIFLWADLRLRARYQNGGTK